MSRLTLSFSKEAGQGYKSNPADQTSALSVGARNPSEKYKFTFARSYDQFKLNDSFRCCTACYDEFYWLEPKEFAIHADFLPTMR